MRFTAEKGAITAASVKYLHVDGSFDEKWQRVHGKDVLDLVLKRPDIYESLQQLIETSR